MSAPTATAPASTESAADPTPASQAPGTDSTTPAIESEMLIEEISIDGMCGVY